MFKSYGKLEYRHNWWLVVEVNEDICSYYRKLIMFYNPILKLNKPKYSAHITVIAGKYEKPVNEQYWNKYSGQIIEFQYNPEIIIDGVYFGIRVQCEKIEDIREELGLNRKIITPWHLTVGNIK